MAVLTRTIISGGGGNYTTIAGWEGDAPDWGDGDIWKGVISDNAEYNESNVQLISSGTPSATAHFWLTVDPSNRHAGVAGTGHARMRGDTNTEHVLILSDPFTFIEWLEVEQNSTGGSDEGIRLTAGTDNALISHCVIWASNNTQDQDGIYTGDWDIANLSVDNCIVYGFNRCQIYFQQFTATARTITGTIDYCTLYNLNDTAEQEDGAIGIRSTHSSDDITWTVYNTIGVIETTVPDEPFFDHDGADRGVSAGTNTEFTGSHVVVADQSTHDDIANTYNITNEQAATDGIVATTQASGSYVVVTSLTAGSENLLLLDTAAGNLPVGNGTDRQGSEPDSRQDFSIDITGATRSTTTVDIGAHNISVDTNLKYINTLLVSNKPLRQDSHRLVSADLISNRKA